MANLKQISEPSRVDMYLALASWRGCAPLPPPLLPLASPLALPPFLIFFLSLRLIFLGGSAGS